MKCRSLMIAVLVLAAACAGPRSRHSSPPGVEVGQHLVVWFPVQGMSPSGKVLTIDGWMVEIEGDPNDAGQTHHEWIDMNKALCWMPY
jgi:hypothetical protein